VKYRKNSAKSDILFIKKDEIIDPGIGIYPGRNLFIIFIPLIIN